MACRKKYIRERACANCKKKKHKCDNEAIYSDNKSSEQPPPKIIHPLSPNNWDEFIDFNSYNILPFYFNCYYEEQLTYEQM
ncbi:2621_t:CDS:2, partial [Cetraspora pellucida]